LAAAFFGLGPVAPGPPTAGVVEVTFFVGGCLGAAGIERLGAGLRYRCKRFSGNTLA
jgi:hypothetical protein